MEIVIGSAAAKAPIWDHFLLKDLEVVIKYTDDKNVASEVKPQRVAGKYNWTLLPGIVSFDLTLQASFRFNGTTYPLLKIMQTFAVAGGADATITPLRWQKLRPDQAVGHAKGIPATHPLLSVTASAITVDIDFVDISRLFNNIHGNTPWYMAMDLLKGTARTILVLASLRGHPFIWYVVIRDSAAAKKDLQANLLYYPADYGGISYVADSIAGITTSNHNTSVDNIQCGGETLISFLNKPLADDDYSTKLDEYLAMMARFKKRSGRNPPPLHHFREVLSYNPDGGNLVPLYWDIPFGFEKGLSEMKQILMIPQINGGEGGIAIKAGLKQLLYRALLVVYTQGNTLTYESVGMNNLILTCYSQSGGNLFTACSRNMADIKGIICFEPQYMNQHLKGEDTNLSLGKDVIPFLIRQRSKVVVVGRHKDGWQGKYLPLRVNLSDLNLLPDDPHYAMLTYPEAGKPYAPDAFPVLARRYSRMLKNKSDPVISEILGAETASFDVDSANTETKVEEIIEKLRKSVVTDEKLVKTLFSASYNADTSGGYYTHNLIVSSGQALANDNKSVIGFFQQALAIIG